MILELKSEWKAEWECSLRLLIDGSIFEKITETDLGSVPESVEKTSILSWLQVTWWVSYTPPRITASSAKQEFQENKLQRFQKGRRAGRVWSPVQISTSVELDAIEERLFYSVLWRKRVNRQRKIGRDKWGCARRCSLLSFKYPAWPVLQFANQTTAKNLAVQL